MDNKRLLSIDTLRGMDMLMIMGLSVLLAAGYMVVCWLLLYFLYRHKVFLKV